MGSVRRAGPAMPLSRLFRLIHWGLLLLVSLTLIHVGWKEWQTYHRTTHGLKALAQLRQGLSAAEMASRERGPMNAVLGNAQAADPAQLKALQDARLRTDLAFDALQRGMSEQAGWWVDEVDATELWQVGQTIAAARRALQLARERVDALALAPPPRESEDLAVSVEQMAAVVRMLAMPISRLGHQAQDAHPDLSDAIHGARMAAELREHAGLLGSLFTPALHQRRPFTEAERAKIEQTRGRLTQLHWLLDLHVQALPNWPDSLAAHVREQDRFQRVGGQLLDSVIAVGITSGRFEMDPAGFAARYVPELAPILGLRDALLLHADQQAQQAHRNALMALMLIGLATLCLLGALLFSMWLIRRRVIRPLAATTRTVAALARGEEDCDIPQPAADDEVAAVLKAVGALKQHQIERRLLAAERDRLIAQLVEHSSTDFLTSLPNRRAFFEAADRSLAQAQRLGHEVAVVLLDLDHFKAVNDTHGHGVGDRTLIEVAQAIRSTLRQGDLVARHGGEEFVMLLSPGEPDAAMHFGERLRSVIAALEIATELGGAFGVTASIGVASSSAWGLDLATLLSKADTALYAAKADGRNRVVMADRDRLARAARA